MKLATGPAATTTARCHSGLKWKYRFSAPAPSPMAMSRRISAKVSAFGAVEAALSSPLNFT